MKINKKVVLLLVLLAFSIIILYLIYPQQVASNKIYLAKPNEDQPINPEVKVNFNKALFYGAISQFPKNLDINNSTCQEAVATLATHHDLANKLNAELFQKIRASNKKISRFIIIGPNHPNTGYFQAITAKISWQSEVGSVDTDNALIDELVDENSLRQNNTVLAEEHSMYTLIPFIAHYFPGAKVVPIIISTKQTTAESFKLAEKITKVMDKETVVIGSIDFSHYLTSSLSEIKDKTTKELMLKKDYLKISSLSNDYVDSPQSLITILKIAELTGANKLQILKNTNSGVLLGREEKSSTSYFTACFTAQ